MNGIHDLGGSHGFGAVYRDPKEPVFYYDWERTAMSMCVALSANGHYNADEFRHSIERMPPMDYLRGTYYEHWIHSFEMLLVEKGVITKEELESGKASQGTKATPVLTKDIVAWVLANGVEYRVEEDVKPSFKVGDKVRALTTNPIGHTRLPRYARGRVGTIAIDHGVFITPDASAHGQGQRPQHVYSVSFAATELWGPSASPKDTVRIDLWDEYLEAVQS